MVRLRKADFLESKIEKAGTSLSTIALLINQSFELESMTVNGPERIERKLREINGGSSENYELNEGNGWNQDTHHDGSLSYYGEFNGRVLYGTETSTTPLNSSCFGDVKEECKQLYDTYKEASGGIYHTNKGSCHVHNSLAYMYTSDDNFVNVLDIDVSKVLPNIAFFMLKFMPVMKWLTMTALDGARACTGTRFDKLDNDSLFRWYHNWSDYSSKNSITDLYDQDRGSYMRLKHNPAYNKMLHWENRMCDTTASHTHMAMWLTINRAITLLAIDFARHDKMVVLTDEEVNTNQVLMRKYRRAYSDNVVFDSIKNHKSTILDMGKQFIGYLGKYFKILNSLDVVPFIEKLLDKPFPEYLATKNATTEYNTSIMESIFNVRNRQGDSELRNSFINTLICMVVPAHDSLAEHQESIAQFMNVEPRKVKSLYQMLKREQVDIEFISGRLVYMGN